MAQSATLPYPNYLRTFVTKVSHRNVYSRCLWRLQHRTMRMMVRTTTTAPHTTPTMMLVDVGRSSCSSVTHTNKSLWMLYMHKQWNKHVIIIIIIIINKKWKNNEIKNDNNNNNKKIIVKKIEILLGACILRTCILRTGCAYMTSLLIFTNIKETVTFEGYDFDPCTITGCG